MKNRLELICILIGVTILGFAFAPLAGNIDPAVRDAILKDSNLKCVSCGKSVLGQECYWLADRVTGNTNIICQDCAKLERCFDCGLPVKTDAGLRLPDGRIFCARDAKDAVASDSEARQICEGVKYDIDRFFARYMNFPDKNVELSIVDKFHLENLFSSPGFHNNCVSIEGATASNPLPNGKLLHTIDLLSYMSRTRLMAVCAHEYTHAWMGENVKHERFAALDRNAIEGFCELVAYKYMESKQETLEMENILRNTYTAGQVQVLLAADKQYGFNSVVDWITDGDDGKFNLDTLDRVRAVKGGSYSPRAAPSPTVTWTAPPRSIAPPPVPSTLVLKSISGTPDHRFALINNATFEPMETGAVSVGQTNVTIRCLEIREDSVVIQVVGSNEKKQLQFAQ